MDNMLGAPNHSVKHAELNGRYSIDMALNDRINDLFAENPTRKNAELARFCGVSRATVTDWRNGKTKTIEGDNAINVAKFFGVRSDWVQNGKGKKRESYINSKIEIKGKVPLISWVQAGNWEEAITLYTSETAEDWIETTAKVSSNAFALRVKGDSMNNPYGFPSLPDGCIVIVDPDVEPINGKIVVAKLNDGTEATIKKLVIDGDQKFLKPLNPQYPVIPINGNCTICAVAVRVEFDL